MKENLIIVEYEKTKNHYVILNNNALMKNPETGEWQKSVIYKQYKLLNSQGIYEKVPEEDCLVFVREFNDFNKKFTLCLDL